jgi:hypothetical protein
MQATAPEPQAASAVLMVRPAAFRRNDVTRPSNRFQSGAADADREATASAALREFDELARALKEQGVDVHVFPGHTTKDLPDEVFPNNWLTTHADGTVALYPMMAWNRRGERRRGLLDALQRRQDGFRIGRFVDLTGLEKRGCFLEGTGSLVLDRVNRVAYACLSPRTHVDALREFSRKLDYDVVAFDARDREGHAIYHTNVMLALGERFAVACLDVIPEATDRLRIVNRLEKSGRAVIEIGFDQMRSFAGNLIELRSASGSVIALSTRAAASLDDAQRGALAEHGRLVTASVDTIETYGGGSVRCMLAEIFLPAKR